MTYPNMAEDKKAYFKWLETMRKETRKHQSWCEYPSEPCICSIEKECRGLKNE
jgi:hypothetical protein